MKNDESRMTNDGMTNSNDEMRPSSIIRHSSFVIRAFVIPRR